MNPKFFHAVETFCRNFYIWYKNILQNSAADTSFFP